MKIKTLNVIEVADWDKAIEEEYCRPYNFQQQDGCKGKELFQFSVPDFDYEADFTNETVPEIINHDKMGVSFEAWLKRDPTLPLHNNNEAEDYNDHGKTPSGIKMWWHRNFYPNFQTLANDFYKRGKIKKGKYAIEIDW